jgi:hypothetical protein
MTRLASALLIFGLTLAAPQVPSPPAPDPDDGALVLPAGFRALVVADNLVVNRNVGNTAERLRGIAVAPNGDIYVKTQFGGIFALRDTNGDGRVDVIKEFGPGDGGTHIAFHDGWLYHSSRTAVLSLQVHARRTGAHQPARNHHHRLARREGS